MSRRKVYEIPGVKHGAPIPMAARVGGLFYSSAIMGADPADGKVPEDPVRQVDLAFANTRTLLDIAHVSPDDVVYMGVYLSDNGLRGEVNRHWTEWFPDEEDRPTRHTTVRPLPGGMAVQLQVVAAPEGDAA